MSDYANIRPWVQASIRNGADIPAEHAKVLLAELRDKDETVQRLHAIEQAARDLLEVAGDELDRRWPISTALLRARLGGAR